MIECDFQKGNFVIRKTINNFLSIPIDHAHEKFNAVVKGEGDAIGLTENPSASQR